MEREIEQVTRLKIALSFWIAIDTYFGPEEGTKALHRALGVLWRKEGADALWEYLDAPGVRKAVSKLGAVLGYEIVPREKDTTEAEA